MGWCVLRTANRFLQYAQGLDIIVEMCFFNCQYENQWPYSPLHVDANIQGVGDCDYHTCQTLDNEALVREQLRYIEKLMLETNRFDNIIYEFVDEPTLFLVPSYKAYGWINALVSKAVAVEEPLPKKHMLAQQLEIGVDFACDDRLSLIVTQYIQMGARQVGGVPALNNVYCYSKPIELNETAYVPAWVSRDLVSISRLESWEFMVGGGAGFNQLNGFFVPSNPAGENETNKQILQGLKNLRAFLENMDYIRMTRDRETVTKVSIGANLNMISEKGRQYALYMHHSFPNHGVFAGSFYEPNYGEYEPVLTLCLTAGDYTVTFVEPKTMKELGTGRITSAGGEVQLACPKYELDIAIVIHSE